MKIYSKSQEKLSIYWRNYCKTFYRILLFYLITLTPVSTLTGCTVTIIDIKLKNLQVLCDNEHAKLNGVPANLKIQTRILELSMQNISNLQPNSFFEVALLRKLIIKSCSLRFVDKLAFKDLDKLESLNLRNNSLELTEFSLPKECFRFLTNLKFLDLSQNPISFIPDFYFKFLSFSLLSLTLSDLADDLLLSAHSLHSLNQLVYLDLTFNNFQTLRKSSLGSIIQRSYYNSSTVLLAGNLWICDCKLRWIREWYFENLQRLTINLVEEIRPGELKILRPVCHFPILLRSRNLFPSGISTVSIQEMKCEERSLLNNSIIKAQENSNVSFHCNFIVNSEQNFNNRIKWFKNGIEIYFNRNFKFLSKIKIDNFKLNAVLIVYKVKLADQGKYECQLQNEDNFKRSSTSIQLLVKTEEVLILSTRSKKLLIYISVSLLIFFLIIFLIGTGFYFCFRFHKSNSNSNRKRQTSHISNCKDIRPKSVTINPHGNHFLLYDDCNLTDEKMINQYENFQSNYVNPCACKDCSFDMKKCMNFSGLSLESNVDISLEHNDGKKFSPCPVHGDCNLSITEIVPNIESKKICPIHGVFPKEDLPEMCTEIHAKSSGLKIHNSKTSVILSGKPRNDIVLSTISKNKNIYLNCPLHGKILSLNHS